MQKKFVALLLVVCMVISMLPISMITATAVQPLNDSLRVQPLVVSDQINYVRIWARRHITDQPARPDVQLVTALNPSDVGVSTVTVQSAWAREHVFRTVAVPGNPDWFYIVAMASGNVLTANGTAINLAPRTGGNQNQHWRLIYTEEGLHYYHWEDHMWHGLTRPNGDSDYRPASAGFAQDGWGAVTHGVYRHIQNRQTQTYLTNTAPNPAPPADIPMVTGVPLSLTTNVARNQISTQWHIATVDYEQMVRGATPDTRTQTYWEDFAVTSPLRDRLNPAGRTRLTWANASGFNPGVTGYNIYVNGTFDAFVPQSNAQFLDHYFYAVTVERHSLRVDALIGNTVIASSEIDFFITSKGLAANAPLRVPPMGHAWYYTWGVHEIPGLEHLEFVPMRWGGGTAASIQGTVQTAINQGHTSILGFNEPDLTEEAAMPIQDVIDRWMDSFVPFRDEIRIVSPVTAWPNTRYMHSMLDGANTTHADGPLPGVGNRQGIFDHVDVIAYHHYAHMPNLTGFTNLMNETMTLWPDTPIWITELGSRAAYWTLPWVHNPASGYGRGPTDNMLYNDFGQLMNFMSDEPLIERFAWFTFRPHAPGSPSNVFPHIIEANNLPSGATQFRGMRTTYDPHTGALWPLGYLFRNYGNPAGYELAPLEHQIDAAGTFDIWLPTTAATIVLPQPVAGEIAPTSVVVEGYLVGSVEWYPAPLSTGEFDEGVLYTATIRLQAAPGRSYQMGILPRDFFDVPSAEETISPAGSGVVTATFQRTAGLAEEFTVTFINYDGYEYEMTVYHGDRVTPPVFTRPGWTFIRWDIVTTGTSNFNNVTADITATAVFYQDRIVRFYNWDGSLLLEETVPHGMNANPPTPPVRMGYVFTGWDTPLTNVTQNLTVTAQFIRDPWFIPGDLAFRQPTAATSTHTGSALYRAVNGDLTVNASGHHTSFWQAVGTANNGYHHLTVDLGAIYNIGEIEVIWGMAANGTDAMRHFEILVTNDSRAMHPGIYAHDAITWTTVAEVSNLQANTPATRPLNNVIFPENAVSGQYVRIRVVNPADNFTAWPRIAAFRVFEAGSNIFPAVIENGGVGASVSPPREATGATVEINAGTRAGYSFAGWTSVPPVVFADSGLAVTTFIMGNDAVTLTANWEATQHAITFDYDGANNATISHTQAAEGTVVSLNAGTKANYNFLGWTATPAVTFADATEAVTTFTMISEPVTITANWAHEDAQTRPITVIGGGTGASATPGDAAEGMTVAINAGTREGHFFIGWTSEPSVTFDNAASPSTSFVMPAVAVEVTANWSSSRVMPPVYQFDAAGGRIYTSYVRVDLSTLRNMDAPASNAIDLSLHLGAIGSGTNIAGWARWHGHQAGNVGARMYFLEAAPGGNNIGSFYREATSLTPAARTSLGLAATDPNPFRVSIFRGNGTTNNALHITFDNGVIPANIEGYLDIPIVYFTNNTGRPLADVTLTNTRNSQILIGSMTIPPVYVPTLPNNVTVVGGGVGYSVTPAYATPGTTITLDAGTRAGELFIGWVSTPAVTFADALSPTTTFAMPAEDITVTALWTTSRVMPPVHQFNAANGRFYTSYLRVDLEALRLQEASASNYLHLEMRLTGVASGTNVSGMARWHGHQTGNVGARMYLLESAPVGDRAYFYRDSTSLTSEALASLGLTASDTNPFRVNIHRAGGELVHLRLTFDNGTIPANIEGYINIPIIYFTTNTGGPLANVSLTNMHTGHVLINAEIGTALPSLPNLVSVAQPSAISITHAQAAEGAWGLPSTVGIVIDPAGLPDTSTVIWGAPTGFDPAVTTAQTATVDGMVVLTGVTNTNGVSLNVTQTINVAEVPIFPPNLVSFATPSAFGITNAQALAGEWNLPANVDIEVDPAGLPNTASVTWGTPMGFDPLITVAQTVTVTGMVALPSGVTNTNYVPLTFTIVINVAPPLPVVQTFAVVVNDSRAQVTGAGTFEPGATVVINAGTRSGFTFAGWTTSSAGVVFANAGSATTSFVMPANVVTVVANWRAIGGDGWQEPDPPPAPPASRPATPTPTPSPTPVPTPTPEPEVRRFTATDVATGEEIELNRTDANLPSDFVAGMVQRDALNTLLLMDEMHVLADSAITLVRLYVGDLNLADEQIVMLVGFAFDPETGEYEVIRGRFSPGRDYFYFMFEGEGIIGAMLYGRPTPLLRFVIGQMGYYYNGELLTSDVSPIISLNRTMLPLRLIAEALGATPRWDNATRTAYIYKGDDMLRLPMGEPLPNGMGIPEMRNNRVLVPARFVIENFDAITIWNAELQEVTVYVW